jgi:hypothetical protein
MQGFGGPFTLVETQAPTNLFGPSNLFTDSTRFGPVPSVTFSSEQLQFLSPAMVKDTMRIP